MDGFQEQVAMLFFDESILVRQKASESCLNIKPSNRSGMIRCLLQNITKYYKDKQECIKDIPDFFPTKDSFIDFMMKTGVESNEIDLKTFLSMEIRSNKLYYLDEGIRCVSADRRENDGMIVPKNNSVKYEIGFSDSDDNMPELVRDFCLTVG